MKTFAKVNILSLWLNLIEGVGILTEWKEST